MAASATLATRPPNGSPSTAAIAFAHWQIGGALAQVILQLLPLQPGEGLFELGQLPHRLRLVGVGEQGGDDVLAKAAGSELATCHLGPKFLASQDEGGHGTLPIVALTSTCSDL